MRSNTRSQENIHMGKSMIGSVVNSVPCTYIDKKTSSRNNMKTEK